jgi:hypothetical protein
MGSLARARTTALLVVIASCMVACSLMTTFDGFVGNATDAAALGEGGADGASASDGAVVVTGSDGGEAGTAGDAGDAGDAGGGLGPIWLAAGTSAGAVSIRTWDTGASAWSAPLAGPDVGGAAVRFVVARETPRGSIVAISTDAVGGGMPLLTVFERAPDGSWKSAFSTSIPDSTRRSFDMEVFEKSGDVLIAYADTTTTTPKFRLRSTAGWSSAASTSVTLASAARWIELAASPTMDEMTMILGDGGDNLFAVTYLGGAWLASDFLDGHLNVIDFKAFDVAYEGMTGNAVLVWGRDNRFLDAGDVGQMRYALKPSGTAAFGAFQPGLSGKPPGPVVLKSEPGTNRIALSYLEYNCQRTSDTCDDFIAGVWTGSVWNPLTSLDPDTTTLYFNRPATAPTGLAWVTGGLAVAAFHRDITGGSLAFTRLSGSTFDAVAAATTTPALPARASMVLLGASSSTLLALVEDVAGELWCKGFTPGGATGTWSDVDKGTPLATGLVASNGVPFGVTVP